MRKYYTHQIGMALMLTFGVITGLGAARRVLYVTLLDQERSSLYWMIELALAVIMIITAILSYSGRRLRGTEVVVSLLFVTYFTYFVIRAVIGMEEMVNTQNANIFSMLAGLAMFSAFILFYTTESGAVTAKAENRMVTLSGFVFVLLGAVLGFVLAIFRYQAYADTKGWEDANFQKAVFYPAMISVGEYVFVALSFVFCAFLLFQKWQPLMAYIGMGIAMRELLFGWLQMRALQGDNTELTMLSILPLFVGITGLIGFLLFIGGAKRGEQEEQI
ncbi:hypothetical protein HB852_12935 [Listeria grandensis]|uniref:Uncharacterized protein n=1 Tax=Listeria grandensis TaxID=1494963 RepID=A0A7X0Y3D1_9LIST|nr:hypothetical protein [Listeria grandensis]MBC1475517.1 hypothetical protein [Listeria grandensis]MBC1936282.1 hypothetical protein [Listeria grandensis]